MIPLRRFLTALLLALTLIGSLPPLHAATLTVGWKIPMELLEKLEPGFREKIHKLERPPAESAFFEAGDELWDVTAGVREKVDESLPSRPVPPDPFKPDSGQSQEDQALWIPIRPQRAPDGWMVWNQRSGVLIVRGYWDEVLAVEAVLGLDGSSAGPAARALRLTLDLADGDGKVLHHLVTAAFPEGEKLTLTQDDLTGEVELFSRRDWTGSLRLVLNWHAGASVWTYDASSELTDGVALKLAQAGKGAEGWTLTAKMERTMPDGSAFPPARWIEQDGHLSELKADAPWAAQRRVDEKRNLVVFRASAFGEDQRGPLQPDQPALKIPPELADELPPRLGDFRPALQEACPAMKGRDDCLAGFDPMTHDTYFIGDEAFLREVGEQVRLGMRAGILQVWVETNEAGGSLGSICLGGEKFLIEHITAGEVDLSFTAEPVIGGYNWISGCALEISLPEGMKLNSVVTVGGKKPVEIARHAVAGVETPITLTAKILSSRLP